MGNSTSKTGPDPELNILLDPHCQPPFTPGSQVSGIVVPTGQTPLPIRLASIAFLGRAVSHITYVTESRNTTTGTTTRTTHRYHHEVPLFEQPLTLCENAWVGGQYNASYRFQFVFPASPDVRYGYSPYKATKAQEAKMEKSIFKDRRVEVEKVYETTAQALTLPPSFVWDDHRTHEPNFARVEYGLQVRAMFEDQPDFVSQLTWLDFLPWQQPYQLVWNEQCREPEVYSSSRLAGAEKSFRGSIKDKFSRHTPSVRHTIGIKLPSHIVAPWQGKRPFDVQVFVRVDEVSGGDVSVESVGVRLRKLTLTQGTSFRAFGCNLGWEYREGRAEHETWRRDGVDLHYDTEAVRVERQDMANSQHFGKDEETIASSGTAEEWLFPAKFEVLLSDRRVVPQIRTCNIGVRYHFHAKVEVEIAGKMFEHEVWAPVEVAMEEEGGGHGHAAGSGYRQGTVNQSGYQGQQHAGYTEAKGGIEGSGVQGGFEGDNGAKARGWGNEKS